MNLAAAFASVLLISGVAQASTIDINLSPPLLTGPPGSQLTFSGTLTNTTGSTVFLNSAGINLDGFSPLNEDTGPFFANAPISLAGGVSTPSIGLFTIDVPDPFAAGPFQGTFTILGGVDANDQTTLGSATFTIQVQETTSIPEPATAALLALGLGTLFRRVAKRL